MAQLARGARSSVDAITSDLDHMLAVVADIETRLQQQLAIIQRESRRDPIQVQIAAANAIAAAGQLGQLYRLESSIRRRLTDELTPRLERQQNTPARATNAELIALRERIEQLENVLTDRGRVTPLRRTSG